MVHVIAYGGSSTRVLYRCFNSSQKHILNVIRLLLMFVLPKFVRLITGVDILEILLQVALATKRSTLYRGVQRFYVW